MMSNKYLLREYFELCPGGICRDLLTEEEKVQVRNGTVFLSGVMQRCDEENGNKRVYSESILKREVQNYMKVVKENRACGELDHPEDSVVNLKNASHMVTSLWWEGKDLMGKIKILIYTFWPDFESSCWRWSENWYLLQRTWIGSPIR